VIIRGIVQAITDGAVRLFSATGRVYGDFTETFSSREFLQHYGFVSRPKAGAELVIVVEGNIITAIGSDDRRYRLAIQEGEAALYDDLGQKVHLTRDGIVIKSGLVTNDGYTVFTRHAEVGTGASGTFTGKNGQVVTVRNGIVVDIS
jgi:phage gp45-like